MKLGKEYDIIIGTLTTEKTTKFAGKKYYFEVLDIATKSDVKNAIQNIFNVTVDNVNIINSDGKIKKYKGTYGKRKSTKKAIVTLKDGQNINLDKLG